MIGETLGQYRIDARLGSGGMGVVYRAHDERLHRIVALKLIGTEQRGSTPDERNRLLAEARAASHLNHPHICTVYEVGEIGGRAFIAMEFVEGRSLAELIPDDGLPAETTRRYGEQIAAALGHAHERGVIHRDLKTANVAINASGSAKVLDFGLARRAGQGIVDGATQSIDMIEPGMLAGTLAYIPPEVLLGQGADARGDIWALGVVLYEMSTGRLPFQGRTEFDLTAAILRSAPQPFPAHVPAVLRSIVLRCLAKEPAQRYQRAGEVRAALEAIHSDLALAPPIAPADVDPRRRHTWAIAAGAIVLTAIVMGIWASMSNRATVPSDAPSGGKLTRVLSSQTRAYSPAISPDGRMIVYVAEGPNAQYDLYTTRVSGGARIRLTDDPAREQSPRFSPDGELIAFTVFDDQSAPSVRIVSALGGPPRVTIPDAADANWSPDGRRLVFVRPTPDGNRELAIAGADGSSPRRVLQADAAYPFLRHPAWSPDARTIAVVRGTGGVAAELWLVSPDGGAPRLAIKEPETVGSESPSFTSDGLAIVHASNRGGAMNIWRLPLSGEKPVQLTTGAGPDESPSIARDGTIAYSNARFRDTLDVYDLQQGSVRTLLAHTPHVWGPAVSADGSEIAVNLGDVDGSWHIWTVSVKDGAMRQLTSGEAGEVHPRYAPDGASLLFHTWNAPRRIGRVARARGSVAWLSFGQSAGETFADVSPDGKTIAFARADREAERIYTAPANGGPARLLTSSPGAIPRWSPDGRTIAFSADRRLNGGIFLISADGTHQRRIARDGGWPVWWPDGKRIGYLALGWDGNARIRIVTINDGAIRTLDSIRLEGPNRPFAVFPDGTRIAAGNAIHDLDEIWVLEPKR
ncbi:MAG TPA: protein kinase [Vicinamibacterales bacterium]|jgi:serine/threonine protein kinase